MVIHNPPSAHARSGAVRAGTTSRASSEARATHPLNGVSRALGAKLGTLAQTRLLPSNEMPAIQDKHAGLFVIPPDPGATPLMNSIAKYVNTILAAKEHLSTMPPGLPAKASLATLLDQHEDLFVQLNDVATLLRFSGDAREGVEREIGSELLEGATKQAMTAFADEAETGTMRSESSAINSVKQERESQFSIGLADTSVPIKERWPKDILPLGMVMRLSELKLYNQTSVKEEFPDLLYDLSLVGLENQRRNHLLTIAKTMPKEDLANMDRELVQGGFPRLSEAEKKKGPSRDSINNSTALDARNASVGLASAAGLELRKLSYEVARHAPEMVIKEMGDHEAIDHMIESGLKGHPIDQFELLLDPKSADYEEKKNILIDFRKQIDNFQIDKGLSVAENLVNSYFESYAENEIGRVMSQFLDGDPGTTNQPGKGKASKSKNKKKGRAASTSRSDKKPSAKPAKMTESEKLNKILTDIKAFNLSKKSQPLPSSLQRDYTKMLASWAPCTFRSAGDSVHYHHLKHAPVDDKLSYMEEAQNYMHQELDERPPTRFEQSRGVMTRRSRDGEFLRLLQNTSDSPWKLATFHSPRFTHQGHEPDGIPKLKDDQQARTYTPRSVENLSSIGASLRQLSTG